MRIRVVALAAALAAVIVPSLPAQAQADVDPPQRGRVLSGSRPIRGAEVTLFATGGAAGPRVLGRARTGSAGTFVIARPRAKTRPETRYLIADGGSIGRRPIGALRFATVLGRSRAPRQVTINELTTVATAFALAQFLSRGRIDGPTPGLPNAAATLRNLVTLRTGAVGRVLLLPPNGSRTSTLATFRSLANLLAGCVRSQERCDRLFDLAQGRGRPRPTDTLAAAHAIATSPATRAAALFRLSLRTRVYTPALKPGQRPTAWTLALRYDGGGGQMDGPGQTAFDRHGNAWITNNYVFSASPFDPNGIVCGDDHVLRLRPDGRNARNAPYQGGGLYGAGYGITIGRDGSTWVSNFGFQGSRCPNSPEQQSSFSRSLSQFGPGGAARSPDATSGDPGGWPGSRGLLFRPQGMATDRLGDVWTASCGNDRLVGFRRGDPDGDVAFTDRRLHKPFDVTVDPKGRLWVSGNGSNSVVVFGRRGRTIHRIARDRAARAGIVRPMGIASDSKGNVWVSNSGILHVPCDSVPDDDTLFQAVERTRRPGFDNRRASVTMIRPDGRPHPRAPFKGAGLILPWGMAIDGNDTVWVANFDGKRLSHLCGAATRKCPAGKRRIGAPISPSGGYAFDGLVRNTGVAIDPSGNVWLVNNWRMAPNPANPGGHQVVVFLGLAEPVRTPLIGAPRTP